MSIAYTRSAIVERYAQVPDGCTQTSAALILIGTRPRTSMARPTSRGATCTPASASLPPLDAVTLESLASSPTHAPLAYLSHTKPPAEPAQPMATSPTDRPVV